MSAVAPIEVAAPERALLTGALAAVAAFQTALAAGAPWGVVAWGGEHAGVLPPSLRLGSAGAAVLWGAAGYAVAHPGRRQRSLLTILGVVSSLGCVVNLASPSLPERLVWVPVTAAMATLAWRLRARTPA